MRSGAADSIPRLCKMLDEEKDFDTLDLLLTAIYVIGPTDSCAPSLMRAFLDSESAEVRRAAEDALVKLDLYAIPYLVDVLRNAAAESDRSSRARRAVTMIVEIPLAVESIQTIDQRQDKGELRCPSLDTLIAWALAESPSPEAIDGSLKSLASDNFRERTMALYLIGMHMKTMRSDVVNKVLDRTRDDSPIVRAFAVKALGKVEERTPAIETALKECAKDDDRNVRAFAESILQKTRSSHQ